MKNYILKGGLIAGAAGILFTAITYFMGVKTMVSWWTTLFGLFFFFGVYIFLGLRYRKLNGGYLSFKDAFVLIFLMGMIASVMGGLFQILLYHVINPELPGMMLDAIIQKTTDMMQSFGAPQDKIDETISKMQESAGQFTVGTQLRGIALSSIWVAILALIVGAIVKKSAPPFENVIDTDSQ